jgi:hypothetical protein
VRKTDASGVLEWSRTYGEVGNDFGKAVEPLSDGYVFAGESWTSDAGQDEAPAELPRT